MHEMALAEGIWQLVDDTARREQARVVKTIVLELGQLASVEAESLLFCLDVVTRGSLAEGARIEIINTPGSGWCLPCAKTVPLGEIWGACPECGSHQVQATGGTEMRVMEIEID